MGVVDQGKRRGKIWRELHPFALTQQPSFSHDHGQWRCRTPVEHSNVITNWGTASVSKRIGGRFDSGGHICYQATCQGEHYFSRARSIGH
jgi:hypothetical protein